MWHPHQIAMDVQDEHDIHSALFHYKESQICRFSLKVKVAHIVQLFSYLDHFESNLYYTERD